MVSKVLGYAERYSEVRIEKTFLGSSEITACQGEHRHRGKMCKVVISLRSLLSAYYFFSLPAEKEIREKESQEWKEK